MKTMEQFLERAIEIASFAHQGQTDKGGNPYIEHPLAVMRRAKTIKQKIVAVLHDVVEDTTITLDDLRKEGFPEEIVLAIDALTRREGETYKAFIIRVCENELAAYVKYWDMQENSDLTRIPNATKEDVKRVETRYKKYMKWIEEKYQNVCEKTSP